MKPKNYYRRHYPRSRFHLFHLLHQFLFHVLNSQLTQVWNSKWASFLGTLHPKQNQFWKIARYFMTPTQSVPPLFGHVVLVFISADKAKHLTQHFERTHQLNLNVSTANHACMVNCTINNFFHRPPLTPHWGSTLKPVWTPSSNSLSEYQICSRNRWYLNYYASKFLPHSSHPPHPTF